MTDRPIIFSAPMVRALLDGRKSMTRRILKPPYGTLEYLGNGNWKPICTRFFRGDRLWCREAFSYGWPVEGNHQLPECNQEHAITYRADGNQPFGGGKWKSPIHMPRWASRLTLIVTDVRVQRLNSISEADAVAEGVSPVPEPNDRKWEHYATHGVAFRALWNSIYGPEAWDANPWCAALTFETHRCNIDQMPGGNHE